MSLTVRQKEQFADQGYLLLEDVLAPEDLAPLIAEFGGVIDAHARRLHAEGKIGSLFEEEGFHTRLARITEQSPEAFEALFSGRHDGPALFYLLVNPKLLDIAASLVGPEIMCHPAYRVRPKLPEHARTLVPWHQDAGYMSPECDDVLQLTVWIPLVGATVENGCLQVIPGAHREGVLRHRHLRGGFYLDIPDEALPPTPPVTLPVPFGGALLLTNRTPHRSLPNTTATVRWSVDVRYQDAALPSGYLPEAGFLARSVLHPTEVVASPEAFERVRRTHQPGPAPKRWPIE